LARPLQLTHRSLLILLCSTFFSACEARFDPKSSASSSDKKRAKEVQSTSDDNQLETDASTVDGVVDETATTEVDGADSAEADDSAGEDTSEMVEDTTPPANIVLENKPAAISNSLSYSFTLSGAGAETYSFQVVGSQTACPGSAPTAAFPLTTIPAGVLDAEGSYRLCIWSRSPAGIAQLIPTEYVWTADANAPVAAVATTGAKTLINAVNGEFVFSGTASDLTLTATEISIKQDASSNNCVNTTKSAFDAVCPNFIAVTPGVTWNFPIAISALTDGSSYEVTLKATDGAGRFTNATNTFTWSSVVTVYAGIQTTGVNNDNNGDLVRLQFDGTVWAETSRWDQSASGLSVNSSIYSIAVLSNGDLFALPQNGGGTRNKRMIKCPAGVLANCTAVGPDVISAADGFSQGLAVIPGTNDLLIGTDSRLLRYNTANNTSIDLLFDVSALPSIGQLRHLIIR
jgi:hypothetical protein